MPIRLIKPDAKRRTKHYRIRGTHQGVYVDRSTGFGDRRQADQFRNRIVSEIDRGILTPQKRDTFYSAAKAYVEGGGEKRFLAPLLEHFAETPLANIRQQDVDAAAVELYPNATPATRNRQVYSPVSAVLRHVGAGFELKRPKGAAGEARTRWITPEQADELVKRADVKLRRLFVFLLHTGCRLSEALGLTWADIDLKTAVASVRKTKNGRPRPAYLTPAILAELGAVPKSLRDGPVFGFVKGAGLYKPWRAMTAQAGLPWVTPHVLRHTFATWMRLYGELDIRDVQQAGGWKDLKSVARYSHVIVDQTSRAADKLPEPGKNP